jgi:hypothetical protein
MLRRLLLTAALAVTTALVAPSTSHAQFQVTAAGLGGQLTGDSVNALVNPGQSVPIVSNLGGGINAIGAPGFITGSENSQGTAATISTPSVNAPPGSTSPNAFGLAANGGTLAGNNLGLTTAGVYIGGTFGSTQTPNSANLSTNTTAVVYNDTNAVQTLQITLTGHFTGPGSSPETLLVHEGVTVNYFADSFGDENNYSSSTDSIQSQGSAAGPSTTGLFSAGTFGVSTGTQNGNTQFVLNWTSGTSYTITQTFTITLGAGESVDFTGTMSAGVLYTPAPGGLILAVAGVPFLGLLRRRMGLVTPSVA